MVDLKRESGRILREIVFLLLLSTGLRSRRSNDDVSRRFGRLIRPTAKATITRRFDDGDSLGDPIRVNRDVRLRNRDRRLLNRASRLRKLRT